MPEKSHDAANREVTAAITADILADRSGIYPKCDRTMIEVDIGK
jgi:hypothetical protein